jgi:hypothetical protein
VLYQEWGGVLHAVAGQFVLEGGGQVGFVVGAYDSSRPLTIDPSLVYSTYLGGSSDDYGASIAVDGAGNAYVTGLTSSSDFPTVASSPSTYGGGAYDAFVTRVNASGTLVYSTYLGGGGDDEGYGIAVDSSGNAYVVSLTSSSNFPTVAALQSTYGGGASATCRTFSITGTTTAIAPHSRPSSPQGLERRTPS